MNLRTLSARVLVIAGMALLLAGCAHRGNDAVTLPETGYYEVHREGTIYVVGSLQSALDVRGGKALANSVSAHGRQGENLVFESDGAALDRMLMLEYDKRHGLSK